MLKYNLLAIIALISIKSIFSQELIVDSGIVLKKGVYKNFEEFKNNSPSLEYKGKLNERKVSYGVIGTAGSVTYYGIEKSDEAYYKIKDVYGFCDGESVYININYSVFSPNPFVKIDYLGRYCYVEFVKSGNLNGSNGNNGGLGVTITSNISGEGIININNGKFYDLSTGNLNDLFPNSKTVNEELKLLNQKGHNYKSFVIKYSELNKNEINREPPVDKKKLEQLICRAPSDTTLDDYISRILFYRNDSRFNKVKLIDKRYSSGYPKTIGMKASHNMTYSKDYLYQIGTWQQYHKNGKVKETVCYNLNGDKHGLSVKYNEKGEVVDELHYEDGKLIKK